MAHHYIITQPLLTLFAPLELPAKQHPSHTGALIRSDLTLVRCITSNNNTTLSQLENITLRG